MNNRFAGAAARQVPAAAADEQLGLGFDQRQFDVAVIHRATGIYTAAPEIEALSRLDLARDDIEHAARRVRGYEFYPGAVAEARRAVHAHLTGCGWSVLASPPGAPSLVAG